MFKNYIKIAWRSIVSRKFYTFLNVSGLALAVACCTLIYLYISYNLSFDRYHKDADRIFRLVHELHLDKVEYDKASSYAEYSAALKNIPQVQAGAFGVMDQSMVVNTAANKHFKEEKAIAFTDADWFKLFTYKWLAGSAAQLNAPGNVVLTQATARKYFGNADAMGQVLTINNQPLKVIGLIADGPYNTGFRSQLYISLGSLRPLIPEYEAQFYTEWGYLSTPHAGFIKLKNTNDQLAVEQQILALQKKLMWKDAYKYFHFKLLPLPETHFDTRYGGVVQRSLLLNLIVIGVLVIAIAVINYINIVVAQQSKRGVEIGTRKVLGGSSAQIFIQFVVESLVTSVIAVAVAILLVILILPLANNWLFVDEPVHVLSYASLALYIIILLLVITVGTGVYPALILSRVSIARVLKNNVLNLPASLGRKVLVVFQNTVTQGLIVCTIIIMLQVQYLKNTDIGFDRKMVITIPVGKTNRSQQYQLAQSLKSVPGVQAFSFCLNPPASNSHRGATVKFDNRDWEKWPGRFAIGDSAYTNTFGLKLIAGRNMRSRQYTREFLINETMAKMLLGNKHKTDVIGKKLSAGDSVGVIVGVVKDFNVNSLASNIEPTVVLETDFLQTNLAVKLSGNQAAHTIEQIKGIYQRTLPQQVFTYQFVDEQIAQLYKKESIQQKLIWVGAVMAIIISSLGLLGLVSLVALQRTKEIGIRKVLGASVAQIGVLLTRDLLWLVLVAFAIATPLAWWAMHNWLQNFAYRIDIKWWIFALGGSFAFLVALLSVGVQAIKAAVASPVDSLRSE